MGSRIIAVDHSSTLEALARAGWSQASAYATDHDGQAAVSALALIELARSGDPQFS